VCARRSVAFSGGHKVRPYRHILNTARGRRESGVFSASGTIDNIAEKCRLIFVYIFLRQVVAIR